jgi:hypothetical protein
VSEGDRPQDVGRVHRRARPVGAPATEEILERYRDAMRAELGDVLEELRPPLEQLGMDGTAARIRPALAERLKLWDLAIKIGRELANGEEIAWAGEPAESSNASRSAAPPRLTARERRALGQ